MPKDLKNASQRIDIYIILLLALTYMFAYVVRFAMSGNDMFFMIMLNVLYLLLIISYFTSIVASLIACFIFVLGYGSYILYQVVIAQQTVDIINYYWVIIVPVSCVVLAFYRTYLYSVQERITELNDSMEYKTCFDEGTNLFNERMFYYELKREMSMAKREYFKVCIMAIKVKYYDEIAKLVGKAGMNDIFVSVSDSINEMTRTEDAQYFLNDNGEFSLILITDTQGAMLIKDRIKNNINQIDLHDKLKNYDLNLELKIGIAEYDPKIQNEMEFMKLAESNMEFDV